MEIPFEYQEAINTYEPIIFEGIRLFPLEVREYEQFLIARPAISFVQQSLPVRYLSMPLLSAYYAMEFSNQEEGRESDGMFARALLFLALSMRLYQGQTVKQKVQEMAKRILVAKDNPSVLKGIVVEQGGKEHKITPILFQRMRQILAEQNGIKLESEDANPELLEAERDIAEANGHKLDYSISSLVTAVATFDKCEERDVYGWPILKLERRRQAYERLFDYFIFGIAAASGTRFKGGNPVPSAFFDRAEKESTALVDMSSVVGTNQVSIGQGLPTQE